VFDYVSAHYKYGYFAPGGEVWRRGRRLATQLLYTKSKLPSYQDFITDSAQSLLLKGDFPETVAKGDGAFKAWNEFFRQILFVIIMKLCVGDALEGPDDPRLSRYTNAVRSLSDIAEQPYLGDFIPLFKYLPSKFRTEVKRNVDEEHRVLAEFIEIARAQFNSGKVSRCMAHQLFEQAAKEELSDLEIEYILNDSVDAAVDTSSSTLEWAVFCLANNTQAQDRLRSEINEVLGSDTFSLEYSDRMPYLQAVLLESMRFGPFAPVPPPRRAVQAVHIDGYDVPEGTTIFTNMHACTRSTEFFPDHDLFRPERFLERHFEAISGGSTDFAPFSAGARMCPAAHLAMMNLSSILCMLLQHYRVRTMPRIHPCLIPAARSALR
jgi:cytochrome P450